MTPEEIEICGGNVRIVMCGEERGSVTYEDGDQQHNPDLCVKQDLLEL